MKRHILDFVLLALLIFVLACRASVCLADWYATSLLPEDDYMELVESIGGGSKGRVQ